MTHKDRHPLQSVTEPLARFIAGSRWENIPQDVRHAAKRAVLNFFAVSLAGCQDSTIEKAFLTYQPFFAGNDATLIGRPDRTDILNAAMLNAMSANVFDYDDTHTPTIIHPTAPVAPAILALAETRRISGIDFLHALILGMEAECRIGLAISPDHYARGWHITSTCGVFGSALAAGRLLGLGPQDLTWAMGTASAQSSGLVETLGTMSKSVSVGNAARNGLLSALLAEQGFDGPSRPLEGRRGYLTVVDDDPDESQIISDLGVRWEILNNSFKPYPCGVVLNPVIEACLGLRQQPQLCGAKALSSIEWIEVVGHPLLRERTDRPDIGTGRESQVSAQHAVAVSLIRGKAGLAEFSDKAVQDVSLRALGATLRFHDDDRFSVDAARVTVKPRNAPAVSQLVEIARGSNRRPLTDQDLEEKLQDLCAYGRSGCDPGPLAAAVWSLDQMDDTGAMMRLARGGT